MAKKLGILISQNNVVLSNGWIAGFTTPTTCMPGSTAPFYNMTNQTLFNCLTNNGMVQSVHLNSSGNLPLSGTITTYGGTATVSGGVGITVAKVDLTAQAASIVATPLYVVPCSKWW